MIRNPNDIQDGAKKIRMLIAGYPGIGKSTLALSAPRPLHIDCDFGIDRIEPRYRMPYIQPRSYDEILNDLKPENLKDFETLVFDTAGKLITLMGLWAIKQNGPTGASKFVHRKNDDLDSTYELLTVLGYEMADDEKALQDGTHQLFAVYGSGSKADTPCDKCKAAHPECDKCCKTCDDHCNAFQLCRKEYGE